MRNFLITASTILFATSMALAGPADPGSYNDQRVGANSNEYYQEYLLADGEITVIELEGFCNRNQDIDLWVYESNGKLITKSTSYGCHEVVYITTYRDNWITIRVENEGKPYATRYNLHIW